MTREQSVAALRALCAGLPGWVPAPAIAGELTFCHPGPGAQVWARVTTGNRLALAGGVLAYPILSDLAAEVSLDRFRPALLALAMG